MDASVLYVSPRVAPVAGRKRLVLSTGSLRLLLLAGCALALAAGALVGDPTLTRVDPELALLLRGMAAIKGLLVAAAVAAALWRFGHPVRGTVATAYLAGVFMVSGATALIWQLSFIVPAAALFHVGGLLLLVVAGRDDDGRSFQRSRPA